MSSLSNQPSGSPFSDYTELCTSAVVPPQTWDWQCPAAMDVGTPRGLKVGGRAGLTDEDKLCFFEQPGRGGVALQVPGKTAGISGSVSLGSGSLGSAGDSPDSPLSSSPSPSPASPGRMPSALACGATARVPLPPVPGSPVRQLEAPAALASALAPAPAPARVLKSAVCVVVIWSHWVPREGRGPLPPRLTPSAQGVCAAVLCCT